MTASIKLAVDSALGIATADALDPKFKSLISVAVTAEIRCRYCNRLDSKFAPNWEPPTTRSRKSWPRRAWRAIGAPSQRVQIDFEAFKAEFGGD